MSDVRAFGAVGDGQADDTAAIEHAVRDGEGAVEFPSGTYRVTRTIVIDLAKTRRTGIVGAAGTPKLLMEGAGPLFEFRGTHAATADPKGFKPEVWQRERMPTVSGLEIEGRHAEADGIRLIGVMQPTITGVLIRRVRNGIHITERSRNVLVSHCHIYHNTGIGVFLDRVNLHQTNLVGNHISYNRLGGVRIEESEIRNLQITGNDIEYNNNKVHAVPDADALPTAEIYIDCGLKGTVREMTIASNTLQATPSENGCNVRIIGSSSSEERQAAGMCTISGNLIGSQETNVHLTACRGVVLEGNYIYSGHKRNVIVEKSRNIVIGANCFGHNPDYGAQELCTGLRFIDTEFLNITGLQVQDAQAGKHTVLNVVPVQRKGLLEFERCRYVNLNGVQVFEGSPVGIHCEHCSDFQFTGCSILDTRKEPLTEKSLRWIGPAAASSLAHCRLNRGWEGPPELMPNPPRD